MVDRLWTWKFCVQSALRPGSYHMWLKFRRDVQTVRPQHPSSPFHAQVRWGNKICCSQQNRSPEGSMAKTLVHQTRISRQLHRLHIPWWDAKKRCADCQVISHLPHPPVNLRIYKYWSISEESGVFTQHISSIIIFISLFFHTYTDTLSASNIITIGNVFTVTGYIVWDLSIWRAHPLYQQTRSSWFVSFNRTLGMATLKGTLACSVALLGLSPILKTLTKDTSDDTIWALTICLFLVNLLFHDYGSENTTNIK